MDDLISRQAVIDAVCEHGTDLEHRGITVLAVANYKQATVDLLESLPSADAVEVVRCKDCKHYNAEERLCNDLMGFGRYWNEHDYCSHGVRNA